MPEALSVNTSVTAEAAGSDSQWAGRAVTIRTEDDGCWVVIDSEGAEWDRGSADRPAAALEMACASIGRSQLYDAATKERIGPATKEQTAASVAEFLRAGDPGVISIDADGRVVDGETGRAVYTVCPWSFRVRY